MYIDIERATDADRETEQGQQPWSKGLPTSDGDYYSRLDEYDKEPTAIRVEGGKVYEFGCAEDVRRIHEQEEWEYLGPITPEDAEHLTSLRVAAQAALEFIEKWFGDNANTFPVIAELRAALNPKN